MTVVIERGIEIEQPPGAGVVWGDLVRPDDAPGIVVFAHGSGSSRHSPRNRMVVRRAQAESPKGAEQGKKLLVARLS